MGSNQEYSKHKINRGYNKPRFEIKHELPSGLPPHPLADDRSRQRCDWKRQKEKCCPFDYLEQLLEEFNGSLREFSGYGLHKAKAAPYGAVFCHRGFYDRALKVPENSEAAIENGMAQGLYLHELDAFYGKDVPVSQSLSQASDLPDWMTLAPQFAYRGMQEAVDVSSKTSERAFAAHDKATIRVTSTDRNFDSLRFSQIVQLALVTKRVNLETQQFASTYMATGETIPDLEMLVGKFRHGFLPKPQCCFQIDLRGGDLPKALAQFTFDSLAADRNIMFKCYNFEYGSGLELENAIRRRADEPLPRGHLGLSLAGLHDLAHISVVFFSQRIIQLALADQKKDPETKDVKVLLSMSYEHILKTAMAHVMSFVKILKDRYRLSFIPEIVHSGLGLGYDIATGEAISPFTGKSIKSESVKFEARVDRALIQVQLDLKKQYPMMGFASCTRLCDVSTSEGELVADWMTGKLKRLPPADSEEGISVRLRAIHGGLYPQSDIVVADDPYAEIAARTWIDEYSQSKLNRQDLLNKKLPYYEWLEGAGEEVVRVIKKLNGPFKQNHYDAPGDIVVNEDGDVVKVSGTLPSNGLDWEPDGVDS